MWFFMFTGTITVVYVITGVRMIPALARSRKQKHFLWTVLVFFNLLIPLAIIAEIYGSGNTYREILAWAAYLSLGFFSLLFTHIVARDFVIFAWEIIKQIKKIPQRITGSEEIQTGTINNERRRFLGFSTNIAIVGITGGLTGYGFYEANKKPVIREVIVFIKNLPPSFEGFKIVQISDVHASLTVKKSYIQKIVDCINGTRADIVAITGDLVDGTVSELSKEVAPLNKIHSSYGTYFVTGNHEYYSGAKPWIAEMRNFGFRVLMNEHFIIRRGDEKIVIGGVTDYRAGQFYETHASSPVQAFKGAPEVAVKILFAHQPKNIYEASEAGVDLQISGHTHGGQIYPWNWLARLQQPYVYGLHKYNNTQLYVTTGAGYWGPPMRIGAPSEIPVIILRRK